MNLTKQIDEGDLGVKQTTAQTGLVNAQTHAQEIAGDLKIKQGTLGLDQTKEAHDFVEKLNQLGIDRTNANTSRSRAIGELFNYHSNAKQGEQKIKLGWSQLSEKQKNDLATQTSRTVENNIRAQAAGGKGGTKPLTPLESNTVNLQLGQAVSYIKGQYKAHPKITWQELQQGLATGGAATGGIVSSTGVPSFVIEAAHEIANKGSIKPQTAAALRKAGVRGLTYNGQSLKVRKAAAKASGSVAPRVGVSSPAALSRNPLVGNG